MTNCSFCSSSNAITVIVSMLRSCAKSYFCLVDFQLINGSGDNQGLLVVEMAYREEKQIEP